MHSDLRSLCFGRKLGSGCFRDVYLWKPDPNWVVKVESGKVSSNVIEWDLWDRLQHVDSAAKWLAPCGEISDCGIYLMQRRTEALINPPEKIPVWLTDTKIANFGSIDGRTVCHDYGTNLAVEKGTPNRLKKVKWW